MLILCDNRESQIKKKAWKNTVSATAMSTPNIFGSKVTIGNFGVTKFNIKLAPTEAIVQVKIWANSLLLMLRSKVTVPNSKDEAMPTTRMVTAFVDGASTCVLANVVPNKKMTSAITISKLVIQSIFTLQPCVPVKCPLRKTMLSTTAFSSASEY